MPLTERKAKNWKSWLAFSLIVGMGGGEGEREDSGMAIQARTREGRMKDELVCLFCHGNWSPGEQLREGEGERG